jgi:hypothetical protein
VRSPDPPADVIDLLDERDPSAFRLEHDAVRWRGTVITATELARVRARFARSFGSCSFSEPVSDLETLGWLPRP